MAIRRDIISFLGIDIQFSPQTVTWEHALMPFKLINTDTLTEYHIEEAMAVTESIDRVREILDAKYNPADLEKV